MATETVSTGSDPQRRVLRFGPDGLIAGLLALECLLWLSDRFQWLPWPKNYAVLTGVAAVAATLLLMLFWLAVALVFRRRFQFTLRSLLVLTTAIAVPCSWFAVQIKKAEAQRTARKVLGRFPGYVEYERTNPRKNSAASLWLGRRLGDDFVNDTKLVCLGCNKVFTDAELAHVDALPRLKLLRIGRANITDEGLRHVAPLTELEDLSLFGTPIGDAGLQHLSGLRQLRRLSLYHTRVTDAGLRRLETLACLESLSLAETAITDDGLEQVAKLSRLKELVLSKTAISDAGTRHLERLSNLERLYLGDTQITEEGVQKLQQALPNCRIEH